MNPRIKDTGFGFHVMVDDTHISRWTEQERRLDHARGYLTKFRHLIPEGGTVIDAGSCIGDHTVTYATMVGPKGRVLAFEANQDVYECCALNMRQYPWVLVLNVGLGASQHEVGIDLCINIGASRLNDSGAGIKIETLDSYADKVDRCDLLKADIEGYEHKMLLGARQFIAKHKPAILLEINRGALAAQSATEKDIFNLLSQMGYTFAACDGVMSSEQYDIIATCK